MAQSLKPVILNQLLTDKVRPSRESLENGTTVPELKRLMGAEALSLLKQHNLLRPLVQQMLMQETFAQVVVPDEELDAARLELLNQRVWKPWISGLSF